MSATKSPNLDPVIKPVFTVEEAAEVLGMGRTATYDAVQRGEIPSLRFGRKVLIPTAALRRLLQLDETA